ncbi:MAG: hypothetical protein SFW36_03810, partial [Leptolyngbyaceae cyanobacterium bins.59]|nr:hypothetical protein [Leptolyngbyaceae cyanobacterium bins.59]
QRLKPALDAIALFELLLPASAELTSHWQAAYKLLRPERSTEDQPTTLQEAIVQLQDTSARGSAFTSIHLFVGYLAQPALGLSIQPELIQWLIQQGTDIKVLLQEVQKKVDQKQAKQSLGQNPYLLFWVQAELNSDRYSVQAYLVSDRERYDPLQATQLTAPATYLEQSSDEKVDREGLKVILRECLDESIGFLTGQNPFDITINLFLPIACVSWAVDHWLADEETEFNPAPEPIGSRYQVVLRIAERLNPQIVKPQLQALWHRKWNTLEHIQHRPAGESLIQADNQVPRTLTITLRSPEIVGFYLVKPPEALLEGNATLFHTLLGSGTPIAIWPRQILMDSCQQRLRECLDSCLAELSRNVQNLRQSAHQACQEGETHIGHHLGLIWEDPKLVPPIDSRTSRLRMPA